MKVAKMISSVLESYFETQTFVNHITTSISVTDVVPGGRVVQTFPDIPRKVYYFNI